MARQIIPESPVLVLEHRVAVLERQVAALTEAVRLLAAALEGTPLDSPDSGAAAPAARRAHELLLLPPLASHRPH
ncbi:hypothetical protein [Actinomadura chibensis]|uniref:Uncharacterized protein n=1 Tax=Actinomadura chibensis TaxID=392828 RepID=A0A5D0NIB3_9ACTN|nr:hypothetical protein [Actinomadura chibensis]TYB43931.1 hypothetical protein FXF69_23470 [Actinomadura chibensis]